MVTELTLTWNPPCVTVSPILLVATNDLVSPSEEPEESDELDASAGAEDEADAASVLDEDPAADGEPVSVVAGAEPEAEPLAEPLTVLVLFAAGVVAVPRPPTSPAMRMPPRPVRRHRRRAARFLWCGNVVHVWT
ncbi:hypothetical protein ACFQ9X_10260 [Catenulispora yoronensis]